MNNTGINSGITGSPWSEAYQFLVYLSENHWCGHHYLVSTSIRNSLAGRRKVILTFRIVQP